MADDAEDVLELDDTLEIEVSDDEPEQDEAADGEGGDEVPVFADDEGAAPAPAEETSVIRDLRKANREMARKLARLERDSRPEVIEIGEKPSLSSCDFDEERFEAELDAWKARKAQAEQAERDAEERAKAAQAAWEQTAQTYQESRKSLRVADFDAAEEAVFDALPEQHRSLLVKHGGAALVYALSRSPTKLETFAQAPLDTAAVMIGELKGKVQMTKRTAPAPDVPLRGNAAFSGGSDKQLARLKAEAQKTGDYSRYFAAKRAAGS